MSHAVNLTEYVCNGQNLLMFPLVREEGWNNGFRIFIYTVAMLWMFLAVALISDIFMCSIEKITSKTKIIMTAKSTGSASMHEMEVRVWNDTVANLSLMALGTSAPEILLNVIEITTKGFTSGELGPATIVGSAAFNLFVITAICIVSIPANDKRRIKSIHVYIVTSIFNIFAYIWLILTLIVISPSVIEIWEALVTLAMFPLLIIVAYIADKRPCLPKRTVTSHHSRIGFNPRDSSDLCDKNSAIALMAEDIGRRFRLKSTDAAAVLAFRLAGTMTHSRGWYRIKATREISGGTRIDPCISDRLRTLANKLETGSSEIIPVGPEEKAIVEFTSPDVAVLENCGSVNMTVIRYGMLSNVVNVSYETCNGTAEAGSDYVPKKSELTFRPYEQKKNINITIIDDDIWEPDEFFYVKLSVLPDQTAELGKMNIKKIEILNDDEPGELEFAEPSYIVKESASTLDIKINRVRGADGEINVSWRTSELSGQGSDKYNNLYGEVAFLHGESEKKIEFHIHPRENEDVNFQVELFKPTNGSKLGSHPKTVVTVVSDSDFYGIVNKVVEKTKMNMDLLHLNTQDWGGQFTAAMNVNGGDIESATRIDYFMHYLSFFWKVLFAFVPPVSIAGGWLTFVISLMLIGMMTAIIGDIASHFGCLVGLSDSITAITFVALGTSMPDTFASRQAAMCEQYADNSVGNINGSNSVNVFLGMGLPWLMASIYWSIKGKEFKVASGEITGSVLVFTAAATFAVSLLMIRRLLNYFGRAELGGPVIPKYISAAIFVLFWVVYVVFSILQSKGIITLAKI